LGSGQDEGFGKVSLANNLVLKVEGLRKFFPIRAGIVRRAVAYVKAVDNVSFHIVRGETLGLVGESGCGKTTTRRCILRLIEPTSGKVTFFKGRDTEGVKEIEITDVSPRELKEIKKEMQIIFQDPDSSLNPRMKIGEIIGEPIYFHKIAKGKQLREKVVNLLEEVGLQAESMNRFPHQFSGGQKQRIGIARALALNPQLIVCDEPVTALDVSIQAQILNLMKHLQDRHHLSYLFIAHDLSVIRQVSDRTAVMYLGRIVETGKTDEVFSFPLHPYTEALLSAVPEPRIEDERTEIILKGDVPSPVNPPSGCYFHPRCNYARQICSEKTPVLLDHESGHFAACHFSTALELKGVQ
jgi:peptide/nickel transport system ATP-binding protein